MGKVVKFMCFLVVTAGLAQGDETENIYVKPNQRVQLDCGIMEEYRYCVWEHGNDIFQTEDIHDGVYPGKTKPSSTTRNQCGIELNNVSAEDYGEWTCKIFKKGGSKVVRKNVVELDEPDVTKVPVTVKYAPDGDINLTFYEITGEEYEIRVNFKANPKPTNKYWQYGESFDALERKVEIPFNSDKMVTKLESSDKEYFTAVLKIFKLNAEDLQKKYSLFVENEIGSTNFQVKISRGKEPSSHDPQANTEEQNNSTGTIIGIIVALLTVVAIALVLVYYLKKKNILFKRVDTCDSNNRDDIKDEVSKDSHVDLQKFYNDNENNGNVEPT